MYKVLLVEDSEESRLVVSKALANSDIALVIADSKQNLNLLLENQDANFDLVIVDIVLPDGTGFEVFEILQTHGLKKETPVFFLTSSSELESKLLAFNLGADDYLVKPISPVELRARVETKLRKSKQITADVITKGDLRVELSLLKAYQVKESRKIEMPLTATEFKILAFLMQNENSTFSQEELIRAVWGKDVHILAKTVVSHVYGLRKKLGAESVYIENIPHVGYRFKIPSTKIETA
tara:strand:- start:25561 stop:26274 length:714 start_codon:yes stop_codon:yes gene_type:complete